MKNRVNAAEGLEDIQKDYDSRVAKYNSDMEAYEKNLHMYYWKQKQVKKTVQQFMEGKIFTSCSDQFIKDTDITVNVNEYSTEDRGYGMLEIRVRHEGQYGHGDNDNVALKWNWDIEIHSSSVKHSTNSYSGLNAVTKENLKELQESVSVMEKLAAIPDSVFIELRSGVNEAMSDIVTELGPEPERVDNSSFFWRKVAALAGTDQAVETELLHFNSRGRHRDTVYYQIVKVTAKMVVVNEICENVYGEVYSVSEGTRISKQKFADNVVQPLNIVHLQ